MLANAAIAEMGKSRTLSAMCLDGPPGTGKSFLAAYLANCLKARLLRFQVFPNCGAADLILDTVVQGDGTRAHGMLLQAITAAETGKVVLLLDEIDKADARVDSFLLNFLQDGEIMVPQLGLFSVKTENLLVIITKNDARELSGALLRRCRVAYVAWPSMEVEKLILKGAIPCLDDGCMDAVLEVAHYLRTRPDVTKAPSTPEMIRTARDILMAMKFSPGVEPLNIGRFYLNAVAQHRGDQLLAAEHKSPIYLGSRIVENFRRVLSKFEATPGAILLPIPKAVLHNVA